MVGDDTDELDYEDGENTDHQYVGHGHCTRLLRHRHRRPVATVIINVFDVDEKPTFNDDMDH